MSTTGHEKSVLLRRMTPLQIVGALMVVLVFFAALVQLAALGYHVPAAAIRAACISNLKKDAQAALLYSQDHDGAGPPAAWMDALAPQLGGNEDLLHCPGARASGKSAYGYAYSAVLIGRRITDVKQADRTPMLFDSTLLIRNAVSTPSTLPSPPRHGGSNSIAYADGHAKSIRGR